VGVCDGLMIRMVVLILSLCGFAIFTCFSYVSNFAHERENFRKIS
jgi:hypothetical protein